MRTVFVSMKPWSMIAAAAIAGFSTLAVAQSIPTPGQVEDTLRPAPELKPAPAVPPVQKPQRPEAPAAAVGKRVTVQQFQISGNTLYDDAQLQPLLADYLDRPITLLDIYAAADRIADHYAANGYTLASVNVPPQKIENGAVQLQVSEGRLARIVTEGETSYTATQLGRYLGDVQAGSVYRGTSLEDGLRLLNTLPGLQARAVVKPGAAYGSSDLVLRITEKPIQGVFNVDNFGRESIGEIRYSALVQFNNPAGVEDQLQVMGLRSEDGLLNYGFVQYSLPLNFSGARLLMSYGHADFEVIGTPVEGRNRSGRITLEQPLLRGRNDQLSVKGGLSRTIANADFSGLLFSGTSITLFEVGATYTHTYQNLAVTQVSTTITTNFNELTQAEALAAASGSVSGDQRLRWELDVQHLQPLFASLQLLARANGVYSPDPLVDTEQYSLGGPSNVRGYPASEVRGDRGYFGSLTLRRPFALGSMVLLSRVFADAGQVYTVGNSDHQSLTAAGLGFDVHYQRIALKLDWAFPLDGRTVSDQRDDSRVFGSLAVSF
jgi:hemolysin activation/secretion protein